MAVNNAVRTELAKLNPSAIIELFELKTSTRLHGACEIYRFHSGVNAKSVSGNVVWAGNTYYAWPIEAEGFEYNGQGTLPRPKLKIANVNNLITAALLEVNVYSPGSDLTGSTVTRIRTMARFLDAVNFEGNINPYGTPDPTATLPEEVYFIDRKALETFEVVEFELAAAFDLAGVVAPKRQAIANICQWIYRSADCGYTGATYFKEDDSAAPNEASDICGKRLSSCRARFGQYASLPFGSFPGVGEYNY